MVSYNILADCHRVKSDYSYTDEAHLGIGYRHKGILAELRYLNADCACLQEVETAYYNDVLYPAMKRWVSLVTVLSGSWWENLCERRCVELLVMFSF